MGILTQIREPVERRPVELIVDPSYFAPGPAAATPPPEVESVVPSTLAVTTDPDVPDALKGSEVYVFTTADGPVAWVRDPIPRRLGSIAAAQVPAVSAAFRVLQNGFRGVVLGRAPGTDLILVKVLRNGTC